MIPKEAPNDLILISLDVFKNPKENLMSLQVKLKCRDPSLSREPFVFTEMELNFLSHSSYWRFLDRKISRSDTNEIKTPAIVL